MTKGWCETGYLIPQKTLLQIRPIMNKSSKAWHVLVEGQFSNETVVSWRWEKGEKKLCRSTQVQQSDICDMKPICVTSRLQIWIILFIYLAISSYLYYFSLSYEAKQCQWHWFPITFSGARVPRHLLFMCITYNSIVGLVSVIVVMCVGCAVYILGVITVGGQWENSA